MLGLLGYSDDNLCLAPALNALQDMLYTSLSYIPLSAPLYTCHLLTLTLTWLLPVNGEPEILV